MIWYYIGLTATHLIAALLGAFILACILMHFGGKERARRKAIDKELRFMGPVQRPRGHSIPDGVDMDGKPYKEEP